MAGVHVLRDGIGGRGSGLDLVDDHRAVLIGKNAVGTALDGEPDSLHRPLCREEHLSGVAFTRRLLEPAVDACALVGPNSTSSRTERRMVGMGFTSFQVVHSMLGN